MSKTTCGLAAASLFLATASHAAGPDALAGYRGESRVLIASAPDAADPALLRQRAIFAALGRAAKARDLVYLEASGESARAKTLRRAAGLDDRTFGAALIGKDGGVKLRAAEPLSADRLTSTIDAMPMRRQERRERGE